MDTMELECPSCHTKLEIDIAFAGGVCRCSTCGTLMTVPADPSRERAETLTRPDRPMDAAGASAGGRPESPGGSPAGGGRSARPEAPGGGSPSPAGGHAPAKQTSRPASPGKPAPAAPVDAGVYVTASGKQVRITSQTAIPTAVRRKAIRASIVAVFVIVMICMVGLVVGGIAIMSKPRGGDSRSAQQVAEDVRKARGNYDPDINPFLLRKPNVIGLSPAGASVVVVLDTSSQTRHWLSMACDALIQGLPGPSAGPAYQVIFARDGAAGRSPETLATLTDASRQALHDELYNTRPFGQANLAMAINDAVNAKPAQIIFITSREMTDSLVDSITAELAKADADLRVDVIHLGDQPGSLEQLAEKRHGQMVQLPVVRLSQWHQAWQDSQQQPNP